MVFKYRVKRLDTFKSPAYIITESYVGGEIFMGYGHGGCGNQGPVGGRNCGAGSSFALIVVLFILLIIVGATFYF